jgi:hypothetical protein
MQQHHQGKGKIVDDAAQETCPAGLDVFQAVDMNTVNFLSDRDISPFGIFPGVTAQGIHGKTGLFQSPHRVIGKLGGGNILRIEKLTQKQDITFLSQPFLLLFS